MLNANDIHQILQAAFDPEHINIADEGGKHKRHKEAKAHGGGHFAVSIVSNLFEGKSLIERHQMIYQALDMPRADIHALSINAKTPKEQT